MIGWLKGRLVDFVRHNVMSRIEALHAEQAYQHIFDRQCENLGIRNDFYPVGAAASHTLMYLLVRVLTENRLATVVELGSGQSTILIDRVKAPEVRHVCYEEDPAWHAAMAPRLTSCDYRLRPLVDRVIDGVACVTYDNLEPIDFDLLLVDGPRARTAGRASGAWS